VALNAGQLDWWVLKSTGRDGSGSDGYEARTVSSAGSKRVIFDLRADDGI
jgi:hypothetical protein